MEMLKRFEPIGAAVDGARRPELGRSSGSPTQNVLSEIFGTGTFTDVLYVVVGAGGHRLRLPRLLEAFHIGHGPHPGRLTRHQAPSRGPGAIRDGPPGAGRGRLRSAPRLAVAWPDGGSQRRAPLSTEGDADVSTSPAAVSGSWSPAGVEQGQAVAFVRGSTAAMTTMEFEPGGVNDLRALLDRLIPPEGDYEHNRLNHDTNSHAHQRASLIGPSRRCRSATDGSRWAPGSSWC